MFGGGGGVLPNRGMGGRAHSVKSKSCHTVQIRERERERAYF